MPESLIFSHAKIFSLVSLLFVALPYSGKVWRGKSLVNLANHLGFAKLKPSKFLLIIITLWLNLSIRQTFPDQMLITVNLPNFLTTKPSRYMVKDQSLLTF